uniref:Uncharacterized protein n=1 Tax=Rhizochromulina marina TaxID=1034831 RepID=A0A7S2W6B9_9STRA|mmetsp:Transcript_16156/g.47443  ORF Transcript_16156/g.47443 Transcript_16156/m.47443 type:complete len:476 (+) Transcript_16156:13-1440(+)
MRLLLLLLVLLRLLASQSVSSSGEDVYAAASLPFLRIRQPGRAGWDTHHDSVLIAVHIYNVPDALWDRARVCLELSDATFHQTGEGAHMMGCFDPSHGVLLHWPEASFTHHAKLEANLAFRDVSNAFRLDAALIISDPPLPATGTLDPEFSMFQATTSLVASSLDSVIFGQNMAELQGDLLAALPVSVLAASQRLLLPGMRTVKPMLPRPPTQPSLWAAVASRHTIMDPGASGHPLVDAVTTSFAEAAQNVSGLTNDILSLTSMVRPTCRRFLNNVAGRLSDTVQALYLEVGVFAASSLCAAVYNNPRLHAIGVDNWSQFGGREAAFESARACAGETGVARSRVNLVDADCWHAAELLRNGSAEVPLSVAVAGADAEMLGARRKVDIYFYDGPHNTLDQYRGIIQYEPLFNEQVVVVVDDWHLDDVQMGTRMALEVLESNFGWEVLLETSEVRGTNDNRLGEAAFVLRRAGVAAS